MLIVHRSLSYWSIYCNAGLLSHVSISCYRRYTLSLYPVLRIVRRGEDGAWERCLFKQPRSYRSNHHSRKQPWWVGTVCFADECGRLYYFLPRPHARQHESKRAYQSKMRGRGIWQRLDGGDAPKRIPVSRNMDVTTSSPNGFASQWLSLRASCTPRYIPTISGAVRF